MHGLRLSELSLGEHIKDDCIAWLVVHRKEKIVSYLTARYARPPFSTNDPCITRFLSFRPIFQHIQFHAYLVFDIVKYASEGINLYQLFIRGQLF